MKVLTYWETLIATRSNIAVNDSYAALWGKKSQNNYTVETYTGTLPATLQTIKGYLENYKIYGNTEQIGTPTPENPIVPSGCGELETTGAHTGQYKLPILSNSNPTDIYLGEVETTRRIKKLVLTGGSSDGNTKATERGVIYVTPLKKLNSTPTAYCTHFKNFNNNYNMPNNSFTTIGGVGTSLWFKTDYTTANDFKSYLAAQYAAGTPVTIWYVLAEPETGIVNEPLMKIDDYADTIDSTQTTVQIPTSAGSTTISWAGEGLAPSEVELVYKVKR